MDELRSKIELAWENRSLLSELSFVVAIEKTIGLLDSGKYLERQ